MDLFSRLADTVRKQNSEGELPDFIVPLLLRVAENPAEFADPVNHFRNITAELAAQLLDGRTGILKGIVQQTGNHTVDIQMQAFEDTGDFDQMGEVRIAGQAQSSGVNPGGEVIGPTQLGAIRCIGGAGQSGYELIDRVAG